MSLLESSPWLQERAWPSIKTYLERDDLILIPVGATEQHGAHAAMMLDTGWAAGISEEVARRTGTLAAPPLHFGWSSGHMGFPGCVTLSAETLANVLVEVCQSLMVHGFKKFVLVNGNRIANVPPMDIAASRLRVNHGALTAVLDIGLIARREVGEIVGTDDAALGHAGDAETSYLLHHRPDLVDMSKAVLGPVHAPANSETPASSLMHLSGPYGRNCILLKSSSEEFAHWTGMTFGVVGDATRATAEKGKRIFEAVVSNSCQFIEAIRHKPVTVRNVVTPV
jgi:creatinine amidohydrolase